MSFGASRGRPPELTQEGLERICDALGIGTPKSAAAAYGGITYQTFCNYIAKAEELLRDGYDEDNLSEYHALCLQLFYKSQEAIANAAINWTNTINKAATNDPNWASYMLGKWFPDLHGSKSRLELTGKDGEAIKTESVGELTPEEKLARVMALAEAAKKRQGQ